MAGPVRQAIDLNSLSNYIANYVPDIELPITIKQFSYGQSNPTYQLTAAYGRRYVLRKKPPGQLLSQTAHQVEREYRIIHALEKTDIPAPKAYKLCEDTRVIGTPFYIMEFLDGRIFEDASFPGVRPEERTEMWREAIRTLAKLHLIAPGSVGLSNFGKPSGFYDRQIKTLGTIATSQAQTVDIDTKTPVGKIPHFDEMVTFFKDVIAQPKDRVSLIHGDYKVDNLVYHKTEPKLIGILDWEMSTLGHPLSDLSNLLSPFIFALNPSPSALSSHVNPAFYPYIRTPGLPSRSQCITWYHELAGWDPRSEVQWSDAFGVFRNGVVMQGIAARYAVRQASSEKAKQHGEKMGPYGDFAWGLVASLKEESHRIKASL